MLKKVVLFIFICFLSLNLFSQSIKNINWVKDSTKIVLYYDIVSLIKGSTYNVEVFCSTDGAETYSIPLKSCMGEIGSDIKIGKKKSVVWDVFKDVGGIAGNVSFKVVATKNPRKRDYFVSYNGTLEAPIGIQVGMLGGVSPYLSFKMNSDFNSKYTYTYDKNSLILDYPYNTIYFIYGDKVKKPRYSFTAGATAQLFNKAFVYMGAGYGKSLLLWEVNEYNYADDQLKEVNWAINNDWSCKGLELEGGLIMPIKDLIISAGGTVVNFRRPTLTFGVGYKFN